MAVTQSLSFAVRVIVLPGLIVSHNYGGSHSHRVCFRRFLMNRKKYELYLRRQVTAKNYQWQKSFQPQNGKCQCERTFCRERLTRKPKVRTAVGSNPTLDSLVAVRNSSPGRPEPCEGNLVAAAD